MGIEPTEDASQRPPPVLKTGPRTSQGRATDFVLTPEARRGATNCGGILGSSKRAKGLAAPTKSIDTSAPMAAARPILVVEDHDDTRELYLTCLSMEGFEVVGAADGVEGIAKAREHKPRLVLLDFALPRMTGGEVLREMRSDPQLRNTPVVLISAQMRQCLANVEGLDYQAALEKPCDLQDVVRAVNEAI